MDIVERKRPTSRGEVGRKGTARNFRKTIIPTPQQTPQQSKPRRFPARERGLPVNSAIIRGGNVLMYVGFNGELTYFLAFCATCRRQFVFHCESIPTTPVHCMECEVLQ